MTYTLNPSVYGATFSLPAMIADKHLKLANEIQLKVIIYIMRNSAEQINEKVIAEFLCVPESEVSDALLFWSQCGILCGETPTAKVKEKTVTKSEKPSKQDVTRRGLEDERLKMLLREAQLKFGRNLKSNEAQTLVWLYDDLGLDVSVILLLLQYSVSEGKANINFIEKTAVYWVDNGVETVLDAENMISDAMMKKLAWSRVEQIFGIEKRKPSENELKKSVLWLDEWKLSDELLKAAYDACVDTKSKFVFSYTAQIIENWHKKGIKTLDDIKNESALHKATKKKTADGKTKGAAYDIDLFEKMLNSDD